MRRKWLVVLTVGLLAAFPLWIGFKSLVFGMSPLVLVEMMIYDDVPPVRHSIDLNSGSVEFRFRVLEKRSYRIDFLLSFSDRDEGRRALDLLRGADTGVSDMKGMPTQFHVELRSQDGSPLRDHEVTAYGVTDSPVGTVARRIDEAALDRGIYSVRVSPRGDFAAFKRFSTSISISINPKLRPLRE